MVFLLLSIIFSVTCAFIIKLFKEYKIDAFSAISINYIVGILYGSISSNQHISFSFIAEQSWIIYAIFLGFLFVIVFNVFAISTKIAGMAISAVASKMSVVIPVVAGIFLYNEVLNIFAIIGIILSLISFYLILKKKEKSKLDKKYFIFPILLFIGNGLNDTLQKFTENSFIHGDEVLFTFTVFVVAFLIGFIITTIRLLLKKTTFHFRYLIAGLLLGIFNFGATVFFLKGLASFNSYVFFPIFNISIVSLSALLGFYLFKEKLSSTNWSGILLALLAILLITFAESF